MSDLQRSFAKAKLAGLPLEPALPAHALLAEAEHEAEETDELQPLPETDREEDATSASSASSASSTGTIGPNSKHLFARPTGSGAGKIAQNPLPWTDYFAQEYYLENTRPDETVIHHIYLTLPAAKGPLFVLHHGAGSSGLSFALFAAELRKALPNCGVLSVDARGHGETAVKTPDGQFKGEPYDLSLDLLSSDLVDAVRLLQAKLEWPQLPDIVLVGHSLGGPIVTDVALKGTLGSHVLGYAVLDVVEGSAMDALQKMNQYLATRPKNFPSLASGIEWHTRSRTLRNGTSARVSVPSLLCQKPNPAAASQEDPPWIWRTDLSATEYYWENWFTGLSKKFLEAKGGKLLILAGTDRLDKELMIGQMQGKYQLQVFPDAGHFIQEDQPAKTAMVVVDFYRRNDRSALVLPPKVGDIMKKKP
ncbi:MAG: hypothetical protein LQ338_004471 [Usnochroma carphineum]|nr:MAG: hypothetical protein LQ338_004471 [Usnochroma carphineum]